MSIDICPDYGDIVSELTNENEKLEARIAELELIIDKLVEGIDSLTSEFPLEIEYIEAIEVAKDWKECEE